VETNQTVRGQARAFLSWQIGKTLKALKRAFSILAICLALGQFLLSGGDARARDGALLGREAYPNLELRPAALTFNPERLCVLIDQAASDFGLPREFFTRLIWKESRFDIFAVSPVGAQGVAQFMPGTARIRGLEDSFDPRQAIPASASFLADLKQQFGNFGLAAAAYNGGPDRVARWLAGRSGLPSETRDYVYSITFRPAKWFRTPGREVEPKPLEKDVDFHTACAKLPVVTSRSTLARAPRAPWGVQVAGGISRRAALQAFKRVRKRYASVIGGRGAIILRSKRRPVRYTARVGAQTRKAARTLCARLRQKGGRCIVRRN
jgi:hypothetical protein